MAKRHQMRLKSQKTNIEGITNPAIRRLCRRGGVKRISGLIYEETRGALRTFLEEIIRLSVLMATHDQVRKTVKVSDVIHALKYHGRTMYGFDECSISYPPKIKQPRAAPPPPPPASSQESSSSSSTVSDDGST